MTKEASLEAVNSALSREVQKLHAELKWADKELIGLTARVKVLEEALERIREWADAYPLEVFPKPDWEKSEAVLSAAGLSLSAISAANMRHVVSGVGNIARAALATNTEREA